MNYNIIGLDLNEKCNPKLIVMCGLQCSGKSTQTKILANKYDAEIISSDQLRIEHPDYGNDKIFKLLYSRVNNLLHINKNVIIDATNTTIKMRKQIFLNVKVNCFKICYIMNTPYEECLNRLEIRNSSFYPHKIPEEVLKKYYYSFEVPFYEEGWHKIIIHNIIPHYESFSNATKLSALTYKFDQKNKHHTRLLDEHMNDVGATLLKNGHSILSEAGYMHDIGKVFTQTFKEGDSNAHYYNHANVGAYIMLCNFSYWHTKEATGDDYYDTNKTLNIIFYINYHMHLYNIQTEKAEKKWRQIFGDEKYNNLLIFNSVDKGNHAEGKNE